MTQEAAGDGGLFFYLVSCLLESDMMFLQGE